MKTGNLDHAARLAAALLIASLACGPGGPGAQTDTTDASTGAPATTTEGPEPTTGPGDPTTGGADTTTTGPGTTDPGTTGPGTTGPGTTGEATTGPGTTGEATTGEPLICGTPCREGIVHVGTLEIGPDTDPASLACIVEVTESVHVTGLVDDAPLAGLGGLAKIGQELRIEKNPGLTDLDAFACLRAVTEVSIFDNGALVSAAGLSNLESATKLRFSHEAALVELPTFKPGTVALEQIHLIELGALPHVDALATWTCVEHSFVHIWNCPSLTSVAGLAGLGGALTGASEFFLIELPALASLEGLDVTKTFGSLLLMRLPLVPDLEALSGLTKVGGTLHLSGLPKVKSLAPLGALQSVQTVMKIGSCSDAPSNGLDGLTSLAGLNPALTGGGLLVGGNDGLTEIGLAGSAMPTVDFVGNPKLGQDAIDAWKQGVGFGGSVCTESCDSCFTSPRAAARPTLGAATFVRRAAGEATGASPDASPPGRAAARRVAAPVRGSSAAPARRAPARRRSARRPRRARRRPPASPRASASAGAAAPAAARAG